MEKEVVKKLLDKKGVKKIKKWAKVATTHHKEREVKGFGRKWGLMEWDGI